MNIRYRVTLSTEERSDLLEMVQGGKVAVRRVKRAQILLAADLRSTDEEIARNVSVGTSTVYRNQTAFRRRGIRGSAWRGCPARSTSETKCRGRSDPLRAGLLEAPVGACTLVFAATRR
jgi:hypothetical protein